MDSHPGATSLPLEPALSACPRRSGLGRRRRRRNLPFLSLNSCWPQDWLFVAGSVPPTCRGRLGGGFPSRAKRGWHLLSSQGRELQHPSPWRSLSPAPLLTFGCWLPCAAGRGGCSRKSGLFHPEEPLEWSERRQECPWGHSGGCSARSEGCGGQLSKEAALGARQTSNTPHRPHRQDRSCCNSSAHFYLSSVISLFPSARALVSAPPTHGTEPVTFHPGDRKNSSILGVFPT